MTVKNGREERLGRITWKMTEKIIRIKNSWGKRQERISEKILG